MNYIHNAIKIEYINLGYLPNKAYHLISDEEMLKAFYNSKCFLPTPPEDNDEEEEEPFCFFQDYYPCPEEDEIARSDPKAHEAYEKVVQAYTVLRDKIRDIVEGYPKNAIPNWVYSYMIGAPVGPSSSELDVSYLYDIASPYFEGVRKKNEDPYPFLTGMNTDMGRFSFTWELSLVCLLVSKDLIERHKSKSNERVPTIFGETEIIKSLRLEQDSIFIDERDHDEGND